MIGVDGYDMTDDETPRHLTVRRYEPADADDVWSVHERAMRASPLPYVENAPGDEPLADVTGHYLDRGGEFLVGLVGDDVVAIGGFQVIDERTVEIRHVRVDPHYQRRGYGNQLLSELEARARSAGARRVTLHTNERLAGARRLYEGNGYEETRRETDDEAGFVFRYYQKQL